MTVGDRRGGLAGGPPKRAKILAGAREVFMEMGFDRASVDAIAARAGVAKATVYNHFEDKAALFVASFSEEADALRAGAQRRRRVPARVSRVTRAAVASAAAPRHPGGMTDLQRYLVEEIATDFADGHVSRREALRRLGLLGLEAVAASSLLAACASDPGPTPEVAPPPVDAPAASTPATAASAPPAAAPPAKVDLPPSLPTTPITFAGPEGRRLRAAWATAEKPKGALLVIHENKGLNDHTRHVAGRFAAAGYAAMALDLLSAEGGTESLGDVANATAALGKAPPERLVADMRAALDELAKRAPNVKLGAIGFCFGGAMTWRLVASKDPRLAAAAPFYGPFPEGATVTGSKAAVLGVFAGEDERVNKTKPAAEAALKEAKLVHEIAEFPGAQHAFFNDTSPRYSDAAAKQAWTKVLDWFGKHLG